jgi:O-antigen ligase
LLLSPLGDGFVKYLPFVGSVDADTVTYRQDLLVNSLQVIRENLWFGSADFMASEEMEALRAGADGGIIDLVNSYIAIALSGGIVGLFFFGGFFLATIWSVLQTTRAIKKPSPMLSLGKALLATSLGSMVIIYTVSSILMIPIVYWMLGGLCVAYSTMGLNTKGDFNSPLTD